MFIILLFALTFNLLSPSYSDAILEIYIQRMSSRDSILDKSRQRTHIRNKVEYALALVMFNTFNVKNLEDISNVDSVNNADIGIIEPTFLDISVPIFTLGALAKLSRVNRFFATKLQKYLCMMKHNIVLNPIFNHLSLLCEKTLFFPNDDDKTIKVSVLPFYYMQLIKNSSLYNHVIIEFLKAFLSINPFFARKER